MKFLIILLIPIVAFSSEGDAFTAHLYTDYKEMGPQLSHEVERKINLALNFSNAVNMGCKKEIAYSAIKRELLRPFIGVLESWANFSPRVEGHHVRYEDSVYRDIKLSENPTTHLGKAGMATFFSINGILVSSDKFGHFFDEGHTYYKMVNLEGKTMNEALQKGIDLENGIFGLKKTGVFSYADLVANRAGYEFWNSLFNDKNNNDYIKCINGKFKLVRRFSFANYVDNGWDEAINCNKYSPLFETRIYKAIANLEKRSGKRLACERNKDKCIPLIKKYGDHAISLISPTCF